MKTTAAGALLLAITSASDATYSANPIRKVVSMLQHLQVKVEAEGAKEKQLYDKYMCYCKTSGGELAKTIAAAEAKTPQLVSLIEETGAKLSQNKDDVAAHQADRDTAKTAMREATALREKEHVAFSKADTDLKTNVAAIQSAVAVLSKGVQGGAFLQARTVSVLKSLLVSSTTILDADRQDLSAFLSGNSEYAPASGEIIGILKQMGDEMAAGLSFEAKAEDAAVAAYEKLMAAKTKEVQALQKMIETKMERIGALALQLQEAKNDLGDTAANLEDDKKFLGDLDKNCASKEGLFNENVQLRTQELAALADTIKMLNDDDALELFKSTLPSPADSPSFLQLGIGREQIQSRALSAINQLRSVHPSHQLDFIALSLRGKKIGFEKVVGMIDNLVAELKQEQLDDDNKQEYCGVSLDKADDSKKATSKSISDLEALIADTKSSIGNTETDIANLEAGIMALDKSVTVATELRKAEHEEYSSLMSSNAAAKELLGFAKNRLNKFYNPKLYKAPKVKEGSEAKSSLMQAAPPPPPESFEAYSKKSEGSNGIVHMLDVLIKDLVQEMTEAETTEKDGQGDYEKMMSDSAAKRAQDSKSLTDKQSVHADLKTDLGDASDGLKMDRRKLLATENLIHALHLECDWLSKYFDVRKEARASEIDSLGNAKAVLHGADYALVQVHAKALRR